MYNILFLIRKLLTKQFIMRLEVRLKTHAGALDWQKSLTVWF